jgi:diguanylate cyclase (GGDEF)-like protein/PAS domain S-box-containing protein
MRSADVRSLLGDLSVPMRGVLVLLASVLGLATVAGLLATPPGGDAWARVQLTSAAALGFAVSLAATRTASGRVRVVRGLITGAFACWAAGELLRNLELAADLHVTPAPSNLVLLPILGCAAATFVVSIRGRVERREEVAFYLDAAIVFFSVTAVIVTLVAPVVIRSTHGAVMLTYATFFVSTAAAALLLDLTVRADRRMRGAYLILVGMVVIGAGYWFRLAPGEAGLLPEAGLAGHLVSLGVLLGALGNATWTDAADDDPRYVRFAEALRAVLPLGAVATMPILLVAAVVLDAPEPIRLLNRAAVGLVLATVAIRQSLLLRDRESAVSRQVRLSRDLAIAEARYRALVERQPGIVYLAEPGEHGRWHYVSPQVETLLGFTPSEWLADPTLWARQIHPGDRERILRDEAVSASTPRTGSRAWEYRMVARDGREIWILDDEAVTEVDVDGQPTMVQGVLLDITERKRVEEALRVSEEQTRLIIETASHAFVGMDADGRVAAWNQRAAATFGWSRDEAMGRRLGDLIIPPESRAAHERGLAHYLDSGEGPILSKRVEVTALHRDGREFPIELTIWPVRTGGTVRFNALVDDITVRKQLEGQLRHQALHDALTGLPNRILFADRLQHALDRANADPTLRLAVFFVDLDDFKTVNDSLGHTAGDQLLAAVADRLRASIRPEDTAARLGGDEFAVLIEDGMPAEPSTVASRILEQLSRPFEVDGKTVSVQASVGVSLSGSDGTTPDELLRNADLAMYLAKARGKNRHELYTPGMHEQARRRMDLKRMLEEAVADARLEVHYQPVVALADGSIVGIEALLRWRAPDDQYVPLVEVIPLAEETGLIIPIGRFVLQRACADLRTWCDELELDDRLSLAVNVSPVQLEHGSLVTDVERALGDAGLDAGALVLEITESALTNDSLDTVRTLRDLRSRGVRIALDDFGTGYSSLARLRRFSVDIVKIDRGFVAAVGTERGDPLLQSIIDLGRSLGMEVVAEGIETAEQRDGLLARGASRGQGFYFSRPVPAAAMGPMLALGRLPLPRRRRRATSARSA